MKYEVYIQSLLTEDRRKYIEKSQKLYPFCKIFKSTDGYNKDETISHFLELGIDFHQLSIGPNWNFHTYGTLACWVSKVRFFKYQIENKIPYAILLEDDAKLISGFFESLEELMNNKWSLLDKDYDVIRLFKWGEGYITSIASAQRILDKLKISGVTDNIDIQLRKVSELCIWKEFKPYYRKWVKTNEGDILKTENLDDYFYDSVRK
jgi:GR25 family glycosyltransferase involved in LPS biosynthesis